MRLPAILAASATLAGPAGSQTTDPIIVTAPGNLLETDDTRGVDAGQIRGAGKPDLLEALTRSVAGVSLQQAQGNPFQPNLVYRGFTASPLQGQAQGLAVYLDGSRFNQPFGDTVQFDLLPQAAIQRFDFFHANPVYGLNALGGAAVIETKTGRSAPGAFASAATGRFGESELTAEGGWSGQHVSAYFALQHSRDDGWRRYSPSTLENGFLDLGWDGSGAGIHLKVIAADTDLTGNGSAPVELLRADYRAVFTHPDNTRNRYDRVSLHPWLTVGEHTRLEASLYHQTLRQRTLNGDAADVKSCADDPELLCLQSADDEVTILRDTTGAPIADVLGGEGYGFLNRSGTQTNAAGALVQLVDKRPVAGGQNTLIVGASYDHSQTGFESTSELGALNEERSVDGLGPIIAQPDGSITPVSVSALTRYTGVFVSDRLPISGSLAIEVGLRWNAATIQLIDRLGGTLGGDHGFSRVNPGFELDWGATPIIRLRAGYSEANRAPSPAELACADEEAPCSLTNFFVADPPLKQVVAHSWEAGGQGKFGAVEWMLTAYRTTNHNDIQFVASDVRGRAFFQNVGETQRQGIEATLGYHHGPITMRAGYAFTDATFRTPLLLNSPDNPAADASGRIMVGTGDRLPGIPRHRLVLSADYERRNWSAGADLQSASGQVLFGDEANLEPPTKGYSIANVRAEVRLRGPFRLFGEVQNIFDAHYATFGGLAATGEVELVEAPGASDPRSLGPGAPRRWRVGVKAEF